MSITISNSSLADIALEPDLRPVIDDLDGLTRRLPRGGSRERNYADLVTSLPPVSDVAGRALGFAAETQRFLALAGSSPPALVSSFLEALTALCLLNAASALTIAIIPPQGVDYVLARALVADSVDASLRQGDDAAMAQTAALAFTIGSAGFDIAEAKRKAFVIETATIPRTEDLREGEPTILAIEQAHSLTAFLRHPPRLEALAQRAALELHDADRFTLAIDEGDLGHEALDHLERARQGASLVAAGDLARICLHAGLVVDGRAIKEKALALTERLGEPRLRSIVAFAALAGDALGDLHRSRRRFIDEVRLLS
ncbi:MAG: hypothetical protein J0J10_11285 [Bosea sp.]|jgi:hypothetical protein|uniref:hypothetical protein n=1 Tax=Bosea sp. (in: a-proteobacteria) TaxID=1871050 RepID=UPI001AD532B8|nr:hypothetical protein [Bosea sp. (in: a-proteobacteria)]MBN9469345.1 hypothetical protein [Bosea sp. (in: a-proteobacteria)]